MRLMLIMRGAPGSGKTHLIKSLGLKNFVVGFDQMRKLFASTVPCVDENSTESTTWRLRPETERAVVAATHAALDARLADGTTVIFDATSLTSRSQSDLIKRARKYGYTPYIVDVQGDLTLDEIKRRNALRGTHRISAKPLEEMWQLGRDKQITNLAESIPGTVEAVTELLKRVGKTPRVHVERTIVVGDVHSCASALNTAFEELDAPGTHWVFAGDLFDRGPDPVGVWNLVNSLITQDRATVVTGNHELNLRELANNTARASFPDTRETRDALLDAGIMAAEQAAFVNATVPAVFVDDPNNTYENNRQPWLITHGGVGEITKDALLRDAMIEISDVECVYGMGERGATYRAKTSYNVQDITLAGRQMHGHRNGRMSGEKVDTIRGDYREHVVCLESGASTGGKVSIAIIDSDGYRVHRYDDGVDVTKTAHFSKPPWVRKNEPAVSLLERMRASDKVNVRPVEGFKNVVAANFTRQAFTDGAWDDVSMHARGLFMDTETGAVLARGYEKFFHLDEAPGRTQDQWFDPNITAYPVKAVKKYNGYLALVASIKGRLAVFSKAGATAYGAVAQTMLTQMISEKGCEQLRLMLERTNVTAVFEVLRSDDPHPINEPGPSRLVLLDAIRNQEMFATDDKLATGIARRFGFEHAADHRVGSCSSPTFFKQLISTAAALDYEGVVLIDAKGYRSKVKADEYARRKSARTALERVWKGTQSSLGQRHKALEQRLIESGLWDQIRLGQFDVIGLDHRTHFDLAGLFDALDGR